jgi:hypothetical protein
LHVANLSERLAFARFEEGLGRLGVYGGHLNRLCVPAIECEFDFDGGQSYAFHVT